MTKIRVKELFVLNYILIAMNSEIPSEENLISKYIKPTTTKLYQRPSENTGKQSRTVDDEENASRK